MRRSTRSCGQLLEVVGGETISWCGTSSRSLHAADAIGGNSSTGSGTLEGRSPGDISRPGLPSLPTSVSKPPLHARYLCVRRRPLTESALQHQDLRRFLSHEVRETAYALGLKPPQVRDSAGKV